MDGFCLRLAAAVAVIMILMAIATGQSTPCDILEFYCPIERKCVGERESTACKGQCGLYGLACDYNTKCYDLSNRCDGNKYCEDGVDELNCGCGILESCDDGSTCYSSDQRCNGYVDCRDKSDEKDCPAVQDECPSLVCSNGDCYDVLQKCDGHRNCLDGSDEWYCHEGLRIPEDYNEQVTKMNQKLVWRSIFLPFAGAVAIIIVCLVIRHYRSKHNANSVVVIGGLESTSSPSTVNSTQTNPQSSHRHDGTNDHPVPGNAASVESWKPESSIPLLPPYLLQPSSATADMLGNDSTTSDPPPSYNTLFSKRESETRISVV